MVITLVSVGSIQRYIFGTNRLRENAGASRLVRDAMEWWSKNASSNLIYEGGGNAALAFDDMDASKRAVEFWSRDCYENQPGLRLVAGHGEAEAPYDAYRAAEKALGVCADASTAGAMPGALPVVRHCTATGLAASENVDGAWLSREAASKARGGKRAKEERVRDTGSAWVLPADLGDLGTTEGESPIAIVHADANGFGKIFHDAVDNLKGADLTQLRTDLNALSQKIRTATEAALQAVKEELFASESHWKRWGIRAKTAHFTAESGPTDKIVLPLLPLISEADDLTFITHGKLGIALAAAYLRHFPKKCEEAGLGNDKSACAGILICHQKFPFSRAYGLAEDLCGNAKKASRLAISSAYLDFHILQGGVSGPLSSMRQSAYRRAYGRPIRVDKGKWDEFHHRWQAFSDWPRSRAKGFLESLVDGTDELYRLRLESRGFTIPAGDEGDRLAALEALDYHVGLAPSRKRQQAETEELTGASA